MNQETQEQELNPTEQKVKKQPKRISLSVAVFLSLLLCVAVFLSTYTVMQNRLHASLNELDAKYAKYAKLDDLLKRIEDNYVRDYDESLLWEAMYSALFKAVDDPYTVYMTAEQYAAYTADRSGSYVGIGISVTYGDSPVGAHILRVTPDSPAERAGLQSGDVITAIEGTEITEKSYAEALDLVLGEEGTQVNLTVLRKETTLQLSAVRGKVPTINVYYEKLEGNIAYIEVLSFSEAVTYDQFKNALEQAKSEGCTSYLFDMRNNPGGSLDVICKCLDLLLPKGITVNIVDAAGNVTTRESDAEHFLDAPMAVLCNGNTASAAELFTADLRDYGLATLVGETTFGKGTVQTISPLSDGSAIKMTTRYYNPMSNVSYDGIGIVPDIKVELTDEQRAHFYLLSHDEDPQMQAAIKALLDKNGK